MRTINVFVIGFLVSTCGLSHVGNAQPPTVVDSNVGSGLLITHTNDPTQDFNTARLSYLDFDVVAAAASIRRGADNMREGLSEVRDTSRHALQESIAELESLARAIEQRSVSSVKRIDEAFARANYALAQRHYLAAWRAREQMAQASVEEELRRSGDYVQRARQQIGLQLMGDEIAVIDRARTVGLNARHRLDLASEEMAQEFRMLSQDLSKLADRLAVRPSNPDEPVRR